MVPFHYLEITTGWTNGYLAVIFILGKNNLLKTFNNYRINAKNDGMCLYTHCWFFTI